MTYILIILCGVIGALISRWHGGGFFKSPKVLKNLFWAIPFALVSILAFHGSPLWVQVLVAVIALALSIAGKAMGHGRGFRLKEPVGQASTIESCRWPGDSEGFPSCPAHSSGAPVLDGSA